MKVIKEIKCKARVVWDISKVWIKNLERNGKETDVEISKDKIGD